MNVHYFTGVPLTYGGVIKDISIESDGCHLPEGIDKEEASEHFIYSFLTLNLRIVFQTYANFSKPKGLALIINNEIFKSYERRDGTRADEINMKNLLEKLDYKVYVENNLSAEVWYGFV